MMMESAHPQSRKRAVTAESWMRTALTPATSVCSTVNRKLGSAEEAPSAREEALRVEVARMTVFMGVGLSGGEG